MDEELKQMAESETESQEWDSQQGDMKLDMIAEIITSEVISICLILTLSGAKSV
jgi:hypothetical protein